MRAKSEIGPVPPIYADMIEDLLRIATIHAAIHIMLVCESRGERFGNARAMTLMLYSLLGVACYHLIFKQLFTVRRMTQPESPLAKPQ